MRCRCDPISALGCQCSLVDSSTIDFSGAGSSASPFTGAVKLDPAAGNQLEVSVSGLLVPSFPYVYAYAADDQNRATGEAISFNANDPHTPGTTIHNPVGDPAKYNWTIPSDGWYELYAQALVRNTNPLTGINLYWEDAGGAGSRYSEGYESATQCLVHTYGEGWFTTGMVLNVVIRYTGAGPADVQGGTRYRTFAELRKVAKT